MKTRGGGVAWYFKDSVNVILRDEINNDKFPEAIFCTVESNSEKTLLGLCYRPPDSSAENDEGLFNLFEQACNENNNCVILGDFNFGELVWNREETLADDHPLINCTNENFLHQLVTEPSRENNFLDLIFSSDENIIEGIAVGEPYVIRTVI